MTLARQGWTQQAIAEALGVTQSAVSRWRTKADTQGLEALKGQKPPGRPPRLNAEQCVELLMLLKQGAEAQGFQGEVWTSQRVASLITTHFGISLGERQVRRLLRRLGWSRQKPVRQATQRDDAAIRRWRQQRWPAIKKKPVARSA